MKGTELITQAVADSLRDFAGGSYAKTPKTTEFWVSSSLVGGCVRQAYYETVEPIVPPGVRSGSEIVPLFRGKLIHKIVQDLLDVALVGTGNITAEDRFRDKRNLISGSIDLVVKFKYEPKPIIVEFKTSGSRKFGVVQKTPNQAHVYQLQAYMLHKDAEHGLLVYIDQEALLDRGEVIIATHEIPRNDEAIKEWVEEVRSAWEKREVPIQSYHNRREEPCCWCLYQAKCYNDNTKESGVGDKQTEVDRLETSPVVQPTVKITKSEKKEIPYGW